MLSVANQLRIIKNKAEILKILQSHFHSLYSEIEDLVVEVNVENNQVTLTNKSNTQPELFNRFNKFNIQNSDFGSKYYQELINNFGQESDKLIFTKNSLFNYSLNKFQFKLKYMVVSEVSGVVTDLGLVQHPKFVTDYDRCMDSINLYICNQLGHRINSLRVPDWTVQPIKSNVELAI